VHQETQTSQTKYTVHIGLTWARSTTNRKAEEPGRIKKGGGRDIEVNSRGERGYEDKKECKPNYKSKLIMYPLYVPSRPLIRSP
jgi:hypothetical protein